jgi:hypothetical protein
MTKESTTILFSLASNHNVTALSPRSAYDRREAILAVRGKYNAKA